MTDTKISGLPTDCSPTLTDSVPTFDIETVSTKRTLLSKVRDLLGANHVNPYMFRAFRTTDVSVVDSATYQIVYNAESYDTNNNFDTTTGKYTVPITGYYQLNASAQINGTTSTGWLWHAQIQIRKNGSAIGTGVHYVYDQGRFTFATMKVNDLYFLTAGDVMDVTSIGDTNSGINYAVTGDATLTFFSGFFVSL